MSIDDTPFARFGIDVVPDGGSFEARAEIDEVTGVARIRFRAQMRRRFGRRPRVSAWTGWYPVTDPISLRWEDLWK